MKPMFPTFRRILRKPVFPNYHLAPNWLYSLRTSRTQNQTLLRLLTLATEQRLSLVPLLEAFADDERGPQQRRIRRLVQLLKSGSELPDALERVPGILPDAAVLAIRLGAQSGTLGDTLRGFVETSEHPQRHIAVQTRNNFVYVAVLIFIAVCLWSFVMIRIVPVYQQILVDFDTYGPGSFQLMIEIGIWLASNLWLILACAFVVLWAFWSGRVGRSARHGFLARLVRPIVDLQSAEVLRNLGIVTASGRPIPGALSTLARYHHDASFRQKLLFVRNEVEQGADLWEIMQDVGLISAGEAAVLESAGRAGNRSWALQELATRKRTRNLRRLELVVEFLRPALVIVVGACIGFIILSLFAPLADLILGFS